MEENKITETNYRRMPAKNPGHIEKWLRFFIAIATLVNFSGLFVPLMDPDAGVYASVSKNMLLRNDWVNLYFQQQDWLDKPHLPFWITALFFKVFGLHDWSYKLPGILAVMGAAWYTWLFAKKYYSRTVALWSVFILLTSLHILISNNDVRAEPYLTFFIIASIYHFSQSLYKRPGIHLIAGAFFAACCMMTKGIFTLAPIGAAIAGELLIKKQWRELFNWKWVLAFVFLVIFISPELYSLYMQFDRHPEKIVYGHNNVSGIRFFLWDSQFGRFTNTGPIKGKGDPSFFLHTLLWAFLPWAILFYAAVFRRLRFLKAVQNHEWFTICSTLFTLLVFSISRFQLPYYTNILFPMMAIITAFLVNRILESNSRPFIIIQNIIAFLIIIVGLAVQFFYKPVITLPVELLLSAALLMFFIFPVFIKLPQAHKAFLRSGLATLLIVLFLNLAFYPDLLKYQSGNQLAFFMNDNFPGKTIGRFGFYMPSGEFYLKGDVVRTDTTELKMHSTTNPEFLFLSEKELNELHASGLSYDTIKSFPEYHITMLTGKFIDYRSRSVTLKKQFLVRLR